MTTISIMDLEKEFEFEVSCVFRCWGDQLDVSKLNDDLGLSSEYCRTQVKGEGIGKIGNKFRGKAKTSQLSYGCLDEFPNWRRLPYKQIQHICNALSNVALSSYNAQTIELQISCYYENKLEGGDCEVFLDKDVINLLSKNDINLRYSILP